MRYRISPGVKAGKKGKKVSGRRGKRKKTWIIHPYLWASKLPTENRRYTMERRYKRGFRLWGGAMEGRRESRET